jgi:hypothetical protein
MNDRALARYALAFVIAVAVLVQGIGAPFAKDAEPQSAQWIADVVQHGRWILPRDYYGFVNRKPPLFYWLSALIAESQHHPVDELRARIVSLFAGAALAVLVLGWTAARIGRATGWLAFAFLLGMYGFASRATLALTDMLMTVFLFAAYCSVYPAVDRTASSGRIAAAGVLTGLAILTKGPLAIVLIVLAVVIYLLLQGKNPFRLAAARWLWAAVTIAIVIACLWYVPAFVIGRRENIAAIFIAENFGHFMPASLGGTGEAARPAYYIVLRLIGGTLPLCLLIPALAIAFARNEFEAHTAQPLKFQLAMVLTVLVLFSSASAKRDDYILPALPPFAIVFAALFTRVRPAASALPGLSPSAGPSTHSWAAWMRDRTVILISGFAIVAILATLLLLRLKNPLIGSELAACLQSSDLSYGGIFIDGLKEQKPPFIAFEAAAVIGALVAAAGAWRRRPLGVGSGLATICLAGSVLWNGVVRPAEVRTRSLVKFAPEVRSQTGRSPVYVAYFDPEFAWYFGCGVPPLPALIARQGAPPGAPTYLVARPRELNRLAPDVRRGLRLVMTADVVGGGGPPALYQVPQSQVSGDRPKSISSRNLNGGCQPAS